MKVTNRYDLPQVLYESAIADQYDSGRPKGCEFYLTTTQLVRPAQINFLSRLHAEELEMDVAEMAWSMLGRGFHRTREQLADEGQVLTEERLYGHVGKWTIGGQIDCYDPRHGLLLDYKATKVYAVAEMKPEWYWQLQINGWLVRQAGFPTQRLAILAILKDWSKKKARFDHSYPQIPFKVLYEQPIEDDEVFRYLVSVVALNERSEPPPCSDEDRWKSGGNVAVMKKDRKRAVKLFDHEQEAQRWIAVQTDAGSLSIQVRPPEYPRCQDYCQVARWCKQWQDECQGNPPTSG